VEHGTTSGRQEAGAGESLTVQVGVLSDDDGFYVEDDGVGISEDRLDEVFERGYSTRTAGTGLGLAIVEEIAVGHAWTVTATEGREGGVRIEIDGVDVG